MHVKKWQPFDVAAIPLMCAGAGCAHRGLTEAMVGCYFIALYRPILRDAIATFGLAVTLAWYSAVLMAPEDLIVEVGRHQYGALPDGFIRAGDLLLHAIIPGLAWMLAPHNHQNKKSSLLILVGAALWGYACSGSLFVFQHHVYTNNKNDLHIWMVAHAAFVGTVIARSLVEMPQIRETGLIRIA